MIAVHGRGGLARGNDKVIVQPELPGTVKQGQ